MVMPAATTAHRKMRVAPWAKDWFELCCAELAGLLVQQMVGHKPFGGGGGGGDGLGGEGVGLRGS